VLPYAIHWFRRDLRTQDNPSLQRLLKKYEGRVLTLFCFDSTFLARPDFSHHRFAFFLNTLRQLKADIEQLGGDLAVLDRPPVEAWKQVIESLKGSALPAEVGWNRDYEPFARQRDAQVYELLTQQSAIPVKTKKDHLIVEPQELLKGLDRGPYQVFSPFQRQWMQVVQRPESALSAVDASSVGNQSFTLRWQQQCPSIVSVDNLAKYEKANNPKVTIALPKAGTQAALATLESFSKRIDRYGLDRDLPGVAGTSHLSIYLKNGSITTRQIVQKLALKPFAKKAQDGRDKFLSELVWREFYYHILSHYPQVESGAFLSRYNALEWQNQEAWFEAWKAGRTGYPLVDAGMRQLNETGWMHNRVRMVVASFLTKDLLIDYRWGERYFMEKLLDGDLAPNNGGWQWAASTGCDPQPYFRIFNPYLQSAKFDPDGEYIRRFVPELRGLDAKSIHEPPPQPGYPRPIVDHKLQRDKALMMYDRIPKGSP
jgi:deoxyribodipyrimidine photo-lyase